MSLTAQASLALELFGCFFTSLTLNSVSRSQLNEAFFEFKRKLLAQESSLERIGEETEEIECYRVQRTKTGVSQGPVSSRLPGTSERRKEQSRQKLKQNMEKSARKKKKLSAKDYASLNHQKY